MKKSKVLSLSVLCAATILGGTSIYATVEKMGGVASLNLSEIKSATVQDNTAVTSKEASEAMSLTESEMKKLGKAMGEVGDKEKVPTTEGTRVNDAEGTVAEIIQIEELTEDEMKNLDNLLEGLDEEIIKEEVSSTTKGIIEE